MFFKDIQGIKMSKDRSRRLAVAEKKDPQNGCHYETGEKYEKPYESSRVILGAYFLNRSLV